ncbi:MAG: hypothetical protein ACREVR_17465 [Burkholderiales bacterium]
MGAAAILMALAACGYAGSDEIDAESAAILARAPIGTAFRDVPAAMGALGFSCSTSRRQFTDAKGTERGTEPHFVCERERAEWVICSKRTRAILLQLNGRLSNVLVNVGRFCT